MKQKLIIVFTLLFFLFSTFGIILAAPDDDDDDDKDPKKLSIRGRVYEDKNCNGERKGGEKGIEGVTITLNPGAITTLTKHDGKYKFDGKHKDEDLPAGIYTVQETDPSGYCSTTPNTITVILVKKKVKNQDFGDHKIGVSPPDNSCCP